MGRISKTIACTDEEKEQLKKMARGCMEKPGLSLRARIILQYLDGWKTADVAKANKVCPATAIRWRERFLASGLDGLASCHKCGRPAVYGQQFRQTILAKLAEGPPEGFSRWNGNLLHKQTGYPKHAIWRFLREKNIILARWGNDAPALG